MKDVAGALELEDERTAQKRYAKKLQEQALRRTPVQVSRNNLWTGTGLPRDREFPIGQLGLLHG